MSRIGRKPIDIPQAVNVDIKESLVKVKGPLGELSYACPESIKAAIDNGKVIVERSTDLQKDRAASRSRTEPYRKHG